MSRSWLWLTMVVCGACAATRQELEAPVAAPVVIAPPVAQEPPPLLQLPPDVRPTRYALELSIAPERPDFSGTAEISVTLERPRQVIWLHGLELTVTASTVTSGAETLPATYEQVNDDGLAKLTLPRPVGPGTATLHLAWTRRYDEHLLGLYLAAEAGTAYAFTQFESTYARRAFPGFDQPAFKTPFDVTLVVPAGDTAVANTPPLDEQPAGPGLKRIHYAPTKPLPTYLLAWAVGPFDVVEAPPIPPSALRSWPVPLRGITPKGRGKDLGFALQASAELLLLEEQYFGLAYPYPKLDVVAVPDFAYGAMENAGEIHYREDLLVFDEQRSSRELQTEIASVIAHEQAHQWFGDLVTMRWWDDAWLNESFATWLAARVQEQWRPSMHARLDLEKDAHRAMTNDSLATARAIRQPLNAVKDIQGQFDDLTYSKGGAVLAMFEHYVDPERFRAGVSEYLSAHANGSGSTDDLLASLSRASGKEVTAAFHSFLDQAGVPMVQASVSCGSKPVLTLRQSRYLPLGSVGTQDRLWQVPVCVRYAAGGASHETCTLLSKAEDTLELAGCPKWLMPDAGGAGYYRWSMPALELQHLRTAGYAQLSVDERISLAQSLRAAVAAGTLPIAEALEAFEPIARDPDGEVAIEATSMLRFVRDRLVAGTDRAQLEAYASRLFTPALERLGLAAKKGEDTSARRLRVAVLQLLLTMEDPAAIKQAVRLGQAYAGLADGHFHPEAVDPDLAQVVLSAAVEHGDAAIFDALVSRLAATEDGDLRERLLVALGSARDPSRSARALALTLDPRLKKQERLSTLLAQANHEATREAGWSYLQGHLQALAAQLPETYVSFLPRLGSIAFCDDARAAEVQGFFTPVQERYPGLPKVLKEVLEAVHLCAAQVESQRASAQTFIRAHTPAGVRRAAAK